MIHLLGQHRYPGHERKSFTKIPEREGSGQPVVFFFPHGLYERKKLTRNQLASNPNLKCHNSFDDRNTLIDIDNRLTGGHHHLIRQADIIALFALFFCGGNVKREQLTQVLSLAGGHNEFEHVQRRPGVMFVQLYPQRLESI